MLHYCPYKTYKGFIFFLTTLFVLSKPSYCQNDDGSIQPTKKIYDSISHFYGKDPLLYNGILYKSSYPRTVNGHQYLLTSDFIKGEVVLRGVRFKNIDLNLDIHNQHLLLKAANTNNASEIIMVSQAWLESFSIGNYRFQYFNFPESTKHIFQVLGNDSILLLYYWKKDLKPDNVNGSKNLIFITKRELSVLMNSKLYGFYNNRSFYHLFAKEKQLAIKKYLRSNKIRVRKASDENMEELINYCSKL